jgi:aminomethyltransferase
MATAPERTALYARHQQLGGRLVPFAGWVLPQQYSSIREEHLAVRESAGLFDLSHMGRLEVSGDGAPEYLQRLVTNDVDRLQPGRAQYTLMCREDGGILDDLVLYRRDVKRFTVVVNASNRDQDLDWMQDHRGPGVDIGDRTHEVSLLAVQGPRAQELLPSSSDLEAIPYFGFAEGDVGGRPALVSRTGYTGEDGFELFVAAEHAPAVWDAVLAAGEQGGLRPCGLGARDVCRLEAGLRLYGNDMDLTTNPYEAGLGWTVRLKKEPGFIGRDALRAVKEAGPRRQLVGLRARDRAIPRHGDSVTAGGGEGHVTSGTYSFWLKQAIGMAMVPVGVEPGGEVVVEGRGQRSTANVVQLPFYRGSVRSAAPTKA